MTKSNAYSAQPLPFSQEREGISANTLAIHHDKLYQGYVNKMNEIDEQLHQFAIGDKPLDSANQTYSELRALRVEETFANNGVYLHEYYFNGLSGDGEIPDNALTQAIAKQWDSIDKFLAYFSASGMAVRGLVVLAYDIQL